MKRRSAVAFRRNLPVVSSFSAEQELDAPRWALFRLARLSSPTPRRHMPRPGASSFDTAARGVCCAWLRRVLVRSPADPLTYFAGRRCAFRLFSAAGAKHRAAVFAAPGG